MELDFQIVHKDESERQAVDALSRLLANCLDGTMGEADIPIIAFTQPISKH